jgi:SPP1 family predicted phage head-tail adaptor
VKRIAVGAMRERVTLQQPVRMTDGGGGADTSWTEVATLWAAVLVVGGQEHVAAEMLSGEVTHEVLLRYRSGVAPSMRFQWGGRTLDILAVLAPDGTRRRLRCLCRERTL